MGKTSPLTEDEKKNIIQILEKQETAVEISKLVKRSKTPVLRIKNLVLRRQIENQDKKIN